MSEISTGRYHGPGQYEIRLKGHLPAGGPPGSTG